MRQLGKNSLKTLKIIHLLGVCCWLGGASCMLLLNISNEMAQSSPGALYGLNMASHVIDIWIVVRFGVFICLFSGLAYGLLTPWGFFKHGWLTTKWILTIFCILSGIFCLGVWENDMLQLSLSLGGAALADADYLDVRQKHFLMSILQIGLLVFMLAISIIKPKKRK